MNSTVVKISQTAGAADDQEVNTMSRLKFWRIERSLSQVELSEASGVGRWIIQLSEVGIRPPRTEHQLAIAEALGVDVSKLFPSAGEREPNPDEQAT